MGNLEVFTRQIRAIFDKEFITNNEIEIKTVQIIVSSDIHKFKTQNRIIMFCKPHTYERFISRDIV